MSSTKPGVRATEHEDRRTREKIEGRRHDRVTDHAAIDLGLHDLAGRGLHVQFTGMIGLIDLHDGESIRLQPRW
jgi:hypothetical protein